MPFSPVDLKDVVNDFEKAGSLEALGNQYASRMNELVKFYGGNVSDVPADPENEYWILQAKLRLAMQHYASR